MSPTRNNGIRIQLDRRHDGRLSTTIKLIGWELNALRALASALYHNPKSRQVGAQLGQAMQDSAPQASGGESSADVDTDTDTTDDAA